MMSVGVTFTRDLKFGLKFRRFYFQFVHIKQCSADYNNRIRQSLVSKVVIVYTTKQEKKHK